MQRSMNNASTVVVAVKNLCRLIALFSLVVHCRVRTVLITGGNSGIGFSAAQRLAASNQWKIVLLCRSSVKAEVAKKAINTERGNILVRIVDLSDLRSVQSFARSWGDEPIDCLALNAGIQAGGGDCPLVSTQGHELTITTNHLGSFYLMSLLRRNLEMVKKGRIVIVGSGGNLQYNRQKKVSTCSI